MDPHDPDSKKHKTIARYLRGAKREKSLEERKRIKEAKRHQSADGRRKPRRRLEGDEPDDGPAFEAMGSRKALKPGQDRRPESEVELSGDEGSVVAVHRDAAEVEFEGEVSRARVARAVDSLAVGDRVLLEEDAAGLRVVHRQPRATQLARQEEGHPGGGRVLAANVEVGVVVLATRPYRPHLAGRVIAALDRGGIEAVICLNKSDLVEPLESRAQRAELAELSQAGVAVIVTSTQTGEGVEELRARLAGRTAVLVGHSGVGKSSLLNALSPEAGVRTGEVRDRDGKGRHTTTWSTVVKLEDGTRMIDTPGIRAFGLGEVDEDDRRAAFPEVEALADSCRFRDCRHAGEPGCAVRAALELGSLRLDRWAAYQRLREGDG